MIAVCLDVLDHLAYDMRAAAESLITASQLAKCFAADKEAWAHLNQALQHHQRPTLRR